MSFGVCWASNTEQLSSLVSGILGDAVSALHLVQAIEQNLSSGISPLLVRQALGRVFGSGLF
jgi:hypothetical protein